MALATMDVEATLRLFRALGDERRLRLLEQLRGGEQCECDLTDELDASQPRLSFHLKTLKDAGLVTDRREGRWVYYAINSAALATLERVCSRNSSPRGWAGGRPGGSRSPFFAPTYQAQLMR